MAMKSVEHFFFLLKGQHDFQYFGVPLLFDIRWVEKKDLLVLVEFRLILYIENK